MIPRSDIIEWRSHVPWKSDAQIEQDLILCWMLIEIYSDKLLTKSLIFRGGTALHKIYLSPPSRYSEDIDFVQSTPTPIGAVMDAIREKFDSRFGSPLRKQKKGSTTLIYRFDSEIPPVVPMRVKIEINTREHFNVFNLESHPLAVQSQWYSGNCLVKTYSLNELLGTKLRALYQRRKGRDLFDIWYALDKGADPRKIVQVFNKYMTEGGHKVTQKEFRKNLALKMSDDAFLGDTADLLRTDIAYDPEVAYQRVDERVLTLLA